MRADRLLSIVLLLQANERLTARALSERLEVSERTILRDMDALSTAGIPVLAARGAGGGWRLLDGYQTKLTGLTREEVKSLFMAHPPKLMEELGLQQASESAWMKLRAALPRSVQNQAESVRQRMLIDPRGWRDSSATLSCLPTLLEALWVERQVRFHYRNAMFEPGDRVVTPLGLVVRGTAWYLVAARDDQLRTYRVARMSELTVLDQAGLRPADFDLASYWEASVAQFRAKLPTFDATYLASQTAMRWIRYRGWRLLEEASDNGRLRIRVRFDVEEEAVQFALTFGADVELVEPAALRAKVLEAAQGTVRTYATGT